MIDDCFSYHSLALQESFDMEGTCQVISQPHSVILFDGCNSFFVVEKEVICSVPATEVAVALYR